MKLLKEKLEKLNIIEVEEDQHRRWINPHHSYGAKKGWLRHHAIYMREVRKRERDDMNKSFYQVAKELEESINIIEAKMNKNDVFDLSYEVAFENLAGRLSFSINNDKDNISFILYLMRLIMANID